MAFAEELAKEANQYNGFNLIVADLASKSMVYVTNRPKGDPASIKEVNPGIHVLSNATLNTHWPKVYNFPSQFTSYKHHTNLVSCVGLSVFRF